MIVWIFIAAIGWPLATHAQGPARSAAGSPASKAALIQAILASRQHPEQAFRSCLGIMRLSAQHNREQMELACQIAHEEARS